MPSYGNPKPIIWIGSSRKDLRLFPKQVRIDIGKALYAAQNGETDPAAKPLRGFSGTSVMEIVERYETDAYRAVYTAKLGETIYVLHAFQKKSKRGVATPKRELDLVRRRLVDAERLHIDRKH